MLVSVFKRLRAIGALSRHPPFFRDWRVDEMDVEAFDLAQAACDRIKKRPDAVPLSPSRRRGQQYDSNGNLT